MSRIALFCLLQALALPALAARPFVTDDARLTTAGSCQLDRHVHTLRMLYLHSFLQLSYGNFRGV